MSELPKGWLVADIGDLCLKVTDGSHNPPKASEEGLPMLSAKNIHDGLVDFNERHRLIPVDQFDIEDKRTRIEAGDILLTIVGTLGRSAVVSSTAVKFTLQRSVAVLSAPQLNPYAFRYFLESHGFQKQLEEQAKGTAQKGVYLKALKQLTILVPPLAEQKRIVEKLDQVLAQVDTIKVRLDGIPPILKRFRQSVLAAAVSGKLTEEWRGEAKILSEVADFQNGFAFKSEWFEIEKGDWQVVKLANIRDGKLFLENSPSYLSEDIATEYLKFSPMEGDTLISMTGTRFKKDYGFGCLVVSKENILINQRVGRIIPRRSLVHPKFLNLFIRSEVFRNQFFKGETGGVNQGNVGSKHIMSIGINLPKVEEQTEIVRLVDQYFAFADTIEKQVQKAQQRVDKLTQSILAKAFRGELVPQDPTDEPADELLKRIATARVEAEALALSAKKIAKKVGKKTTK